MNTTTQQQTPAQELEAMEARIAEADQAIVEDYAGLVGMVEAAEEAAKQAYNQAIEAAAKVKSRREAARRAVVSVEERRRMVELEAIIAREAAEKKLEASGIVPLESLTVKAFNAWLNNDAGALAITGKDWRGEHALFETHERGSTLDPTGDATHHIDERFAVFCARYVRRYHRHGDRWAFVFDKVGRFLFTVKLGSAGNQPHGPAAEEIDFGYRTRIERDLVVANVCAKLFYEAPTPEVA